MRRRAFLAAACALALASCTGVYGPKGNDTGGIIPWSVENELLAPLLAGESCGYYGKFAVITTIHRVYGDFITYQCVFGPPRDRKITPKELERIRR